MATSRKKQINFLKGWPNASLLPMFRMKESAYHILSDPPEAAKGLSYAPDLGYLPLREQIGLWLSDFYGPRFSVQPPPLIDAERLCVSGGASQNLACVIQAFTDPIYTLASPIPIEQLPSNKTRRNVWMVVPTYFLACRMFEDGGFSGRLRGVPEDSEGIDLTFLRGALERTEKEAQHKGNDAPKLKPPHPWNKRYKHVFYCVPTYSNPSGRTMSLARRENLVRLAREFDALIVTDDVYDFLGWPHTRHADWQKRLYPRHAIAPRIVDVDRFIDGGAERDGADGFGNAISQGSFSKLSGPGCRTGWAEGTHKAMYGLSQVGSNRSGGAASGLVATFMADMLRQKELQAWIQDKLQPELAARCYHLRSAITELLVPLGVQFWDESRGTPTQEFEGGYFIAIQLPEGVLATELTERCKHEEQCIIAPGSGFAVWGDEDVPGVDLTRMIRLCFSWEQEDLKGGGEQLLREGIERVARMLRSLQAGERGTLGTKSKRNALILDDT